MAKTYTHAASKGGHSLFDAANWADMEAVNELLAAGIPVDQIGRAGRTPLHQAILWHVAADINKLPDRGWLCIIDALIAAGADVHVKNTDGQTPLDAARHDPTLLAHIYECLRWRTRRLWIHCCVAK